MGLVLVLGYGLMVSFLATIETRLVFPAPSVPEAWLSRSAREFGAEELRPVARDGVQLYGWRLRARGERAVVLFSGNGGTVGGNPLLYRRLVRNGFDVWHINYRGYPGSAGSPSEEGLRRDAQAAWAMVTEEFPPERVTILGRSLGGGVAVGLAAEVQPQALVLCCTFESLVRVAAEAYPWLPVRLFLRNRFDSAALAPRVMCPVLIVHGAADSLIPSAHAHHLARHFPKPPKVVLVEGAEHNDELLSDREAWAAFVEVTAKSPDPLPEP